MKTKQLAPYILYKLAISETAFKTEVYEFHPADTGAEVKVLSVDLDEKGNIKLTESEKPKVLSIKEARSLYKKLVKQGFRVSHRTAEAFFGRMLSGA